MERILDENEKIRRAEEIYYRRNNKNISLTGKRENTKSTIKGTIKTKILFNLLVLFNISVLVFAVQNKDFIFTEEFLGIIANYNSEIGNKITGYVEGIWKSDMPENAESQTMQNEEKNKENEIQNEAKIETEISESSSMSEMELDIQNLQAAYTFIKPIEGTISSGFGARESEYQNVTGYHTGIDIAKEKGSIIKASMGGIVEQVSSEGDYGMHIKIRCNNVTTLYAHCSKIYVKEGQIVAAGDSIAEVGSTGNSTGNHLHFEIRVEDRFVDPSRIISF